MHASLPDALLLEILEHSRAIRDLAMAGDWITAEARENDRQTMIRRCFAPGTRFLDPPTAADALRQILELDRQTLQLASTARPGLHAQAHRLRQGRAALLAYSQTQG